jgi:hypothetical protein
MQTLTISGYSDDLIEIDGAINEEFDALRYECDAIITVSDGTALRINFDRHGVWRITPIHKGEASLDIVQAPADAEDDYSDKATLTYDRFSWVAIGSDIKTA